MNNITVFLNIQVSFDILYNFTIKNMGNAETFPMKLYIDKPILHNVAVGDDDVDIL